MYLEGSVEETFPAFRSLTRARLPQDLGIPHDSSLERKLKIKAPIGFKKIIMKTRCIESNSMTHFVVKE